MSNYKLVKLTNSNIKQINKALEKEETENSNLKEDATLHKGDIVLVSLNDKGHYNLCPDKDGCVYAYRPLSKDTIAYSYIGESVYKLKDAGKEVWDKFADALQFKIATEVLDGKKVGKTFEKAEYINVKKDGLSEIVVCPASIASLASYSDYAKKVENIAIKMDKQTKKLNSLMKDVRKAKPSDKVQDAEIEPNKEENEKELEDV